MADTNNVVLNVSASSYQTHINQLKSYISELSQQKSKLKEYRRQIGEIWKGESASQYTATMDKQIAKVEQAESALNKTLAAIQNILDSTNTIETQVISDVQDAEAEVDNLFT